MAGSAIVAVTPQHGRQRRNGVRGRVAAISTPHRPVRLTALNIVLDRHARRSEWGDHSFRASGGVVRSPESAQVMAVVDEGGAPRAEADGEERFRATFEQAAVGIAHVAPDTRWLRVNRKLCQIVGYDRDELLGRSFEAITHPDDIGEDRASRTRLVAGEVDHFALEKRYLRRNGDPVWVRVTVSLRRRSDDEPDYFIAVIEDIDGRRRTEDALRRMRAEMEQLLALHVASQTAAAIAHDLNQPLSAVTSYAEAARRLLQAAGPVPERAAHALQAISEQAQRAGRVVRELLEFLQRGAPASEALNLNELVLESIAVVDADGLDDFAVELRLAVGLPAVKVHRGQVERVLVNLVRNAIDAMRGVGIASAAVRVEITTAAADGMALVSVRDRGPGLDAEVARRLFEPFFSTKANGIGMGLAVSRALVEANAGRLWFEPADGGGATFRFTLPFTS